LATETHFDGVPATTVAKKVDAAAEYDLFRFLGVLMAHGRIRITAPKRSANLKVSRVGTRTNTTLADPTATICSSWGRSTQRLRITVVAVAMPGSIRNVGRTRRLGNLSVARQPSLDIAAPRAMHQWQPWQISTAASCSAATAAVTANPKRIAIKYTSSS
jgi:hypothetical protein